MSKTITLTFPQTVIQEHIDRHNGAVVPLNTEANVWCAENAIGQWSVEREADRTLNTPVVFFYTFASDRDATLFMMFHDGATDA